MSEKKPLTGESFASAFPDLALEWHPTKNGTRTPDSVAVYSSFSAWWLGKCSHEWQTAVYNRSRGSRCPYCSNDKVLAGFNDLQTTHPDLVLEWHPTKNAFGPDSVTAGSKKKVMWQCKNGHEWQTTVLSRTTGKSGCPYCANKKLLRGFNDFATRYPALALEWHPTKNLPLTPSDFITSADKAWWKCSVCGHEWAALPKNRAHGHGCPICRLGRVTKGLNDLQTTHPALALEWHPTANPFGPDSVTAGSHKKVMWQCREGHEWSATVFYRTSRKTGCPICNRKGRAAPPK